MTTFQRSSEVARIKHKRNAGFWGAMQPCGERQSRIPLRFIRATLLEQTGRYADQ